MSPTHPAVEAVITKVQSVYGRWRRDTTVAQMRADWEALFCARGQAIVDEVMADGVRCQWISAPGIRSDSVVMYFHGGGFQVGSLASHQELMAEISAAAGVRVLGVDYRLAPEHTYPAAHDDAWTSYNWLMAQGVPAHQIALAGDSAGGGLALSLLLRLKSQAKALPAATWAMSAWTDLTASGSSYQTHSSLDPIHQRPMILTMARKYLGTLGNPSDVFLSPLLASLDQLEGLPPLLLQVGERETVVSDSEDFVEKARRAGVAAELQVWPGMIHVFQQFPAELVDARQAIEAGAQFLAAQFDAARFRKISK
jgi:epsilon-lactone hydrolase